MKDLDKFVIYGINHNELDLIHRENFVLEFKPYKKLKLFLEKKHIEDGLLLSTCLRNEFYLWEATKDIDLCFEKVEGIFVKRGLDALEHLYSVTCGFDSKIPGEEQILTQMKKAYLEKMEKVHAKSPLNTIFNKAIALGKRFRNISKINEKSVSVESLGIKEAEKYFDNLQEKKLLIVGTGAIANSVYKILKKKRYTDISVIKRSKTSIEDKIDYHTFDDKIELFYRSDAIFSTTSAPHEIFHSDEFHMGKAAERKRIMLDFAVPRDVDPKLGLPENQKLINLEELNELANTSYDMRCQICEEYQWMIDEAIEKTLMWFKRSR